jgi:hypothetical protein
MSFLRRSLTSIMGTALASDSYILVLYFNPILSRAVLTPLSIISFIVRSFTTFSPAAPSGILLLVKDLLFDEQADAVLDSVGPELVGSCVFLSSRIAALVAAFFYQVAYGTNELAPQRGYSNQYNQGFSVGYLGCKNVWRTYARLFRTYANGTSTFQFNEGYAEA